MQGTVAILSQFEELIHTRSVTVKSMGINICLFSGPSQLESFTRQVRMID